MSAQTADHILSVSGITKRFGGFAALQDVAIDVRRGAIHAIIGPNGAGKTTFFNLVSGILRQDSGNIALNGQVLNGLRPYQRTIRGVARTFQNIRLFEDMSVLENVLVGQHCRHFDSIWHAVRHAILRLPFTSSSEQQRMHEFSTELLDFVGLAHAANTKAADLPYGERRLLEIARALATEPELMLLDEPAAGMNPAETEDLDRLISKLRERGVTILLVEHDMNLVMGISDQVTVLNFGQKIAEGVPSEVQNDPDVIAAYLGTDE